VFSIGIIINMQSYNYMDGDKYMATHQVMQTHKYAQNEKYMDSSNIEYKATDYKADEINTANGNGRVNILGPNIDMRFAMNDRIPVAQCASFREAMTGNWNDTALSDAYFSARNIQMLQNGIRAGVYNKSNGQYVVGEQNCDELKIIMRSVFLQHSKNLAVDIPGQIQLLNEFVLNYAVNQVYGEADGYMKYKRDASTLVVPLSSPILSYSNDKQLELKHWF
jgi:hypothetical protein